MVTYERNIRIDVQITKSEGLNRVNRIIGIKCKIKETKNNEKSKEKKQEKLIQNRKKCLKS